VINVGSGNADGFEEYGHETETISSGLEELAILCDLIWAMLTPDDAKEKTETNLV
jgi:hypothetical protein